VRVRARWRRFVKQRGRVLKLLGYPLFAVLVFLLAVYLSLPRERIKDRLERELSQESGPPPFGSGGFGIGLGMDVRITEMDLHLLSPGLSVTGVTLRPRKTGLGSPIGAPSSGDGKDKKPALPLYVDRLDVRLPVMEALSGNRVVGLEVEAFGGTLEGSGGLSGDGAFVNGKLSDLVLGRIANLGQMLPLPMTGTLSASVNAHVPELKLPAGAPPRPARSGAPPLDMPKATGSLEIELRDGTLGDGKAKLVVPGDPFLAQGLTFPKLKLGSVTGRVIVDRGRATVAELHGKSLDAELWIDGHVELKDPLPLSELHLYVRFKPSPSLVQREPTIEILNNAMSAGRRADGALGFAVLGSLAAPRSRPAKEPPDGVTIRAAGMGAVGPTAAPSMRPAGFGGIKPAPETPAPAAQPALPPPSPPPLPPPVQEVTPPPPPPPSAVALPPPPPPLVQEPPPPPKQLPPPEQHAAEKPPSEPPPPDPPSNFPSNQRGF
jgi:type II secretion system protein N